ncbi:MAG: hypothetical protein F3743_04175 [Nitrospinae bacterium]|nr:hypothetical protein [Nitrospinota bacterium]MZH04582.1 hypothetical protein [Nitrospinota bacterium]
MIFKIADFFIGTFSGGAMAFCIHMIIPAEINMFLGMFLGGAVGMVMMLAMMLVLMPLFGAFEVMIPLHINGMLVGMASGMLTTLSSVTSNHLTILGALIGFSVSIYIYFSNKYLTQS